MFLCDRDLSSFSSFFYSPVPGASGDCRASIQLLLQTISREKGSWRMKSGFLFVERTPASNPENEPLSLRTAEGKYEMQTENMRYREKIWNSEGEIWIQGRTISNIVSLKNLILHSLYIYCFILYSLSSCMRPLIWWRVVQYQIKPI